MPAIIKRRLARKSRLMTVNIGIWAHHHSRVSLARGPNASV
jgi:hypothetical protein